jgi:hypothetical protein
LAENNKKVSGLQLTSTPAGVRRHPNLYRLATAAKLKLFGEQAGAVLFDHSDLVLRQCGKTRRVMAEFKRAMKLERQRVDEIADNAALVNSRLLRDGTLAPDPMPFGPLPASTLCHRCH